MQTIEEIRNKFKKLACQADEPTLRQIIEGWEFLRELNKIQQRVAYTSILVVIDALMKGIPPDQFDGKMATQALFSATQRTFLSGGGELIRTGNVFEEDAITNFASAMRTAVIQLSLPQS